MAIEVEPKLNSNWYYVICEAMCMRRVMILAILTSTALAQQVVQRGPMGRPAAILDSVGQWSDALRVLSAPDVDMYIPDVSAPAWLQRRYQDFQDRGHTRSP